MRESVRERERARERERYDPRLGLELYVMMCLDFFHKERKKERKRTKEKSRERDIIPYNSRPSRGSYFSLSLALSLSLSRSHAYALFLSFTQILSHSRGAYVCG